MLRLVADGRTAGEIATQLFISSRTAEHHIQHIYTKIGVSQPCRGDALGRRARASSTDADIARK